MRTQSICSVPGCERTTRARGWCSMHYARNARHGSPTITLCIRHAGTPEERFWAWVDQGGPVPDFRPELGPCWPWTGLRQSKGYGQLKVGGHMVLAHRFAYELLVGPIPPEHTIDHLCRNHSCCNPAHVEPVTNQVNVLRGIGETARNARKTHCPQGHPYDADNTYRSPQGWRQCRTCLRARNQRLHHFATTPTGS